MLLIFSIQYKYFFLSLQFFLFFLKLPSGFCEHSFIKIYSFIKKISRVRIFCCCCLLFLFEHMIVEIFYWLGRRPGTRWFLSWEHISVSNIVKSCRFNWKKKFYFLDEFCKIILKSSTCGRRRQRRRHTSFSNLYLELLQLFEIVKIKDDDVNHVRYNILHRCSILK